MTQQAVELNSLSCKHTSTHGYLQQNTEEMDLLSSPDATHRDKKNRMTGLKRKNKERQRRGWDMG